MRVVIFEPDYVGHRLQYVRVLLESLLPWTKDVILVTSQEAATSTEFKTHLDAVSSTFRLDTRCRLDRSSPSRVAVTKLRALCRALGIIRPGHVYIPYADGLAQTLGAIRCLGSRYVSPDMQIEGILMRGRFAYPRQQWYDGTRNAAWLTALRLAPFSVVHQLDPIPFAAIRKEGGPLSAKTRLIPEPVEPIPRTEKVEARRRLGIPTDGRYIASIGYLDRRKGTHLLVRAFSKAKLGATDRLLLMGKIDPEIRPILKEVSAEVPDGRLVIIDEYVTDERLGLGLCAADVVCAPYDRHIGSSGIVVRAAAAERPVLASDYGWVGAVISAFKLGHTCPVNHLDQFGQQISRSLDEAAAFRLTEGGHRFTQFHTFRNFSSHLTANIRIRYGSRAPVHLMPWENVMAAAERIPTLLSP
jgi:glycosyltransferase involved in cell wall biosynthesis